MPGIYGPPQPAKPAARAPDPPARPDSPGVVLLRWIGTFVLFVAAMALWIWVELQQPSEQQQQLIEIQHRIDHLSRQPMPRFDITLPPFEPLQTAEIIPSSSIIPAEAPPPRQTAERIPRR